MSNSGESSRLYNNVYTHCVRQAACLGIYLHVSVSAHGHGEQCGDHNKGRTNASPNVPIWVATSAAFGVRLLFGGDGGATKAAILTLYRTANGI